MPASPPSGEPAPTREPRTAIRQRIPAIERQLVGEVCRKAGISGATCFNFPKTYAVSTPSELKRLRQLEEENAKLKGLVAHFSLDKAILQETPSRAVGQRSQVRINTIGFSA